MTPHRNLLAWVLGIAVTCTTLIPATALAFANVAVGDSVENVELTTLAGGKEALLSPHAQANVFIFFRPQQENSVKALKAIAECERTFAGKPVRWVAVVSSSWSAQEVRASVALAGAHIPVLIDQDDALYGKLGVRLHPVVGVANEKRALMQDEVKGAVSNRFIKMGEAYLGMEQYDKAAAEARKLLQTDSHYAPAHVLLGDALSSQGKCAEAKLAYQEAVKLSPQLVAVVQQKKSPCGP